MVRDSYYGATKEIDDGARSAEDAALCSARRVFAGDATSGEDVAAEVVAAEEAGNVSARQARAAQMLAQGMSVNEVARELKLNRGTIFRWRRANAGAFTREVERCSDRLSLELEVAARRLLVKATAYMDRLMNEDFGRADWAARILRNQFLWQLARPKRDVRDEQLDA